LTISPGCSGNHRPGEGGDRKDKHTGDRRTGKQSKHRETLSCLDDNMTRKTKEEEQPLARSEGGCWPEVRGAAAPQSQNAPPPADGKTQKQRVNQTFDGFLSR